MEAHTRGSPELTRELRTLKRRGCNVLVVSDAAAADCACRRLLGEPSLDRRYVFLPTTAGVADVLARCPTDDPRRLGVVDAATATRTRSAAPESVGPALGRRDDWRSRVDALDDLSLVVELVAAHLDRVAPADPGPGDVRFCLDALDPFLDALDADRCFRLVHALAGCVRSVGGMGHVHVADAIDDRDRRALEPVFDATVRVESGDGGPRHRWRLHDAGYETDWLPLHC
jgi:hypothetical protein